MEIYNSKTNDGRISVKIDSYGLFVYKIILNTRRLMSDYPIVAILRGPNRKEHECFRDNLNNFEIYQQFDYIYELKNRA